MTVPVKRLHQFPLAERLRERLCSLHPQFVWSAPRSNVPGGPTVFFTGTTDRHFLTVKIGARNIGPDWLAWTIHIRSGERINELVPLLIGDLELLNRSGTTLGLPFIESEMCCLVDRYVSISTGWGAP
jgi:hypothetical protein